MAIPTDAELADWQWVADPHADAAVAAILGEHPRGDDSTWRRIDQVNGVIRGWQDNASVAGWRADPALAAAGVGGALERYVAAARSLPEWAEPERIARAEGLFMEHGALSVTILFCASLPECYVVPDLAAVLHATGQLEDRAEHRIRTTGAMIFPVMMRGGLTSLAGSGIAQVMKVRLIHATVRHLIVRGSPEAAAAAARSANDRSAASIPPLGEVRPTDSMHRALFAHGWDFARSSMPNSQEELAYTLLTFSYVFLRSLRRLGIGLAPEEERDYLHAWNVAGHFLGIRRELMVDTMQDAERLFARMQARGRADWARQPGPVDARPRLAAALMGAMKSVIPPGPFESFPVLLARRLMEPESVRDLGLNGHVSRLSRGLFYVLMGAARGVDALVRVAAPDFSLSRLVTRLVGYRLTCALLMSQTRELAVPASLRPGIRSLIGQWGHDAKAPRWLNALEDRYTTPGEWSALDRPSDTARGA